MRELERKKWWTPKQAAAFLQVSVHTIYAYMQPRKYRTHAKLIGPPPPFRRFGAKVIRLPVTDFIKWAERLDTPTQGKH